MQERDETQWEAIATASGMIQANIIRGRLESQGIVTRLRYEAVGSIYAITIDGLGAVRILVPSADCERARELLSRTYEDGDLLWEENRDPNGRNGS
ncbi:MAG: putative signal transducing protein [Syntrophales bacterium]